MNSYGFSKPPTSDGKSEPSLKLLFKNDVKRRLYSKPINKVVDITPWRSLNCM